MAKKKDHLTIGMDLESEVINDDELRAFDDKAVVKSGVLDPTDFKIVPVKKLACAICVINNDVKLPVRKDKNKHIVPYKHEGLVVYRKREIDILKSKKASEGALQTIHAIKEMWGGEVLPELSKPLKKFATKAVPLDRKWGNAVHSTQPTRPPDYVKAPGGSTSDPTQEDLDWYWNSQDVEEVESVPVQEAQYDDDGWYKTI